MDAPPPRSLPDLAPALVALPLFPLPDVVLMPGALLPLHVFEPRYRQLTRDVLAGHRSLAVVQIVSATELDAHGHPRVARVAGVGTIVDHAELPGGRFHIAIMGRARVELDELPFAPPYRRARAHLLLPTEESTSSVALAALVSTSTSFVSVVRARDPDFEFRMPRVTDAGSLADHCAQHLLIDGRDRQRALELTSVTERVRFVTDTLAMQQMSLAGPRRGDLN